jgi:hypothetical protein
VASCIKALRRGAVTVVISIGGRIITSTSVAVGGNDSESADSGNSKNCGGDLLLIIREDELVSLNELVLHIPCTGREFGAGETHSVAFGNGVLGSISLRHCLFSLATGQN